MCAVLLSERVRGRQQSSKLYRPGLKPATGTAYPRGAWRYIIDNFGSYNQLYGSIGAILILMLYIWLNAIVLLLGFELNASIAKLKQA